MTFLGVDTTQYFVLKLVSIRTVRVLSALMGLNGADQPDLGSLPIGDPTTGVLYSWAEEPRFSSALGWSLPEICYQNDSFHSLYLPLPMVPVEPDTDM